MTDVKRTSGGPSVPVTTLVQCDQETIVGDGSHEHPLRVADGLLGGGSGGGGGGGGGSGGGSGGGTVVTDGTTVLGDGSVGNPIRVAPSGGEGGGGSADPAGTYRAGYRGGSVTARPGQPVFVPAFSVAGGVTTVQPATATNIDADGSTVDGVVSAVHGDGTVSVAAPGPLTLTTAQWDAVTGMTGGLVLGTRYYLAPFPAFARLVTRPETPGLFLTQVGVGLNPTTMLVLPPARPVRDAGDLVVVVALAGQKIPVGSAVFVSDVDQVSPATGDVSLLVAQAIGVVIGYDNVNDDKAVVQLGGVVTLTADQWDAATADSPVFHGLATGAAYYVGPSSQPGSLTKSLPVVGAATQVGVALSPTRLLLAVPTPRRLT